MHRRVLIGFFVALAVGCGDKPVNQVSGKVTLDDKPLANAQVSFQPEGGGPGSLGKTDANGEYSLKASNGKPGAQVGKHRVSITLIAAQVGSGDERPPRGGWPQANMLPKKYADGGELSFEVPPGGTTAANFTLTSK